MYNKSKLRDGETMIWMDYDFLLPEAIESSDDKNYYEKVYSNLVVRFLENFALFYKKNNLILNNWIKTGDEKIKIFSFFFEISETITFNDDNTFKIHYNKLKKFRKMKNESEKLNYLKTTTEIILGLIEENNGKFDSQEFKDLNNLAQEIIGFIIDKNERISSIFYNLKELTTKNDDEKLEIWYWNKVDNIKTNFTNTRILKI